MEVGIKVLAENIRSQAVRHANSCFFTMVAVDDDRKPVAVPALRPFSPEEQRRHAAAIVRKQLRHEFDARFESLRNPGS
jgi:acyl-CoA hydrolase